MKQVFYLTIAITIVFSTSFILKKGKQELKEIHHSKYNDNQGDTLQNLVFVKDIAPIIQTNCNIAECHDGTQPPYLKGFKRVKAWSSRIRERINYKPNPMPPEFSPKALSEEDRAKLTKWIDEGCKEE